MAEVKELTPAQLNAKLGSGSDALLLDVRTPTEFEARHMSNALLLPLDQLSGSYAKELPPEREIVCICEHGVRSMIAARFLIGQGYSHVFNLAGGMAEWTGDVESK